MYSVDSVQCIIFHALTPQRTHVIPYPPRLPSKSVKAAVPLNFSPSSIRVDSWQSGLCNDNPKAPTSAVLMRHILKLMY